MNGQVVVWDIAEYQDKLKMNRKSRDEEGGGRGHNRLIETSIVRWMAVSSIEGGHRGAVSDLWWMPEGMEVRCIIIGESCWGQSIHDVYPNPFF